MTSTRLHRSLPVLSGLFLVAAAVTAVAPMVGASADAAATPKFIGSKAFAYSGAAEDWVVPAGVTSIVAKVCGASGENMLLPDSAVKFAGKPGHGGCVNANVRVTPLATIHVRVGGAPTADAGGWPDGGFMSCPGVICGGGGGGSSDIRIGGGTLADRVLVGGGGGGGGAGALGGAGGNAGGGGGTLGFEGERGGIGVDMTSPAMDSMGGGGGSLAQEWNGGCGVSGSNGLTPSCAHNDNPNWLFPVGLRGVANHGGDASFATHAIGGAGGGGYFGGGSGCGYSDFGQTNLGTCGGGGGSSYADYTQTSDHFLEQGTAHWYDEYLLGNFSRGDNGTVTFSWPGPEVPVVPPSTAPATTSPATTTPATTSPATTTPATTSPATTAPATTSAPTTSDAVAPATTSGPTTTDHSLPATGSRGGALPMALLIVGVGLGMALIARRRPA